MCSNKIDKNLQKRRSSSKKAELDISEFVVGTLYIQTVLWMTPLFCPVFVWVTPIILYIMFHYTATVVKYFYRRSSEGGAQSSDDDTSYLIFIFTNLVFIGTINTSYGYYLIQKVTHKCGPFKGMDFAIDTLFERTNIITMALEVVTFPPILISLIFFFIAFALLNRNKSVVSDGFIQNKEREYQLLIYDLQKRIDNLKKRQKFALSNDIEGPRGKNLISDISPIKENDLSNDMLMTNMR